MGRSRSIEEAKRLEEEAGPGVLMARIRTGRVRRAITCRAALVVVGALVASTAACGSKSAPTAKTPESVGQVNISIGTVVPNFGSFWIAMAEGLFAKNGVDVHVVDYANPLVDTALLTSGQTDLAVTTFSSFMPLQAKGQPVVGVYALATYDWRFGAVIAKPSITSIADLKALGSACKLASPSAGTGVYGWGLAFQKAYGLNCQHVNAPTLATGIALLASGAVDSAVTQMSAAGPAASSGVGRIIFDPTKVSNAEGEKIVKGSFPHVGVVGLKDNLKAKKAAVVAFIRSLREAEPIIAKSTSAQLAALTVKSLPAAWATTSPASLVEQWDLLKPGMLLPPDQPGFVSKATWMQTVSGTAGWGLTAIDPHNPNLSYDRAVDMSYFNTAVPK